ncbi:hypothetical protein KBY29_08535 [Ruegeria pomeroyi]|nr:hypothetical protein [Ruegeria pomeroyi]
MIVSKYRMPSHVFGAAFFLAALGVTSNPGAAEIPKAEYFSCQNKVSSTGNWPPTRSNFQFLDAQSRVRVWDPIIMDLKNEPIVVPVKVVKGGKLRFKWRLSVPSTNGVSYPIGYKVDFDPEARTGMMWVSTGISTGRRGGAMMTCKLVEGR